MTHAICTVGLPGAGKSVAKEVADELGISTINMGDMVRRRADEAGVTGSDGSRSESIGEWVTNQRDINGKGVVSSWTLNALDEDGVDPDLLIIDGVRSLEEYERFTSHFDQTTLLHVKAPEGVRFTRMRERGRAGEDEFTKAQFRERDERELDWGVGELIVAADVEIENGGDTTFDEFTASIKRFISQLESRNN